MPINFTATNDMSAIEDDSDDVGIDPDVVPLIGTVKFTPQFSDERAILAPSASPRPTGFKIRMITGYMDTDGQLKTRPGGAVGVRLPANDPIFGIDQLWYRVDYDLATPIGETVKVAGGFIKAPSTDTVVSLVSDLQQTGSKAIGVTRGLPGPGVDDAQLVDGDVQFYVDGEPVGDPLDLDIMVFDMTSIDGGTADAEGLETIDGGGPTVSGSTVDLKRMQQRRGLATAWTSGDPILSPAEFGVALNVDGTAAALKLGDGIAHWSTLKNLLDAVTASQLNAAVAAAVAGLVDSSPTTLNTLKELADALGDDPNFAATIATALGNRQPLNANLTAIAALASAANKLLYATGSATWALADLTAAGRALVDDADATAQRLTLGVPDPRRPLNNMCAAVGDSITAANSTGYIALQGDMWFNHLCIDTEQRIQFAGYFATPGFTLASIQSTHLPTVLAMNPLPGACVVFGGTNDMGAWGTGGASFTASKATLRAIVASLRAVGVVPILCTIPPITNSTAAVNQNTVTWNTWIRRYATSNGFPLIDANAALMGNDGAYASGLSVGDGVHPNQKGHRLIAQRAIDDGVWESFPAARPLTSKSSADLSNMFGSGTASYGLFLTGTAGVAAGLAASGTGYTPSIVAPTTADDLHGNWQQLSRTTGDTGSVELVGGMTLGSVGDVLAFSARVQTENIGSTATPFFVMVWCGAPANDHAGLYAFESDVDGLLYVEYPIPSGAAFLYWSLLMGAVGGPGNPTVRVGEVTVRNLTTGGVLT